MSLLLFAAVEPRTRQADLYLEIEAPVTGANGNQTVDILIGNRGELVSRDNFDAVIETEWNGRPLCHARTNFVTPIAPGESIRALRFEIAPAASRALASYAVHASIRLWDRARTGPQKQTIVALPAGRATCVALKPVQ